MSRERDGPHCISPRVVYTASFLGLMKAVEPEEQAWAGVLTRQTHRSGRVREPGVAPCEIETAGVRLENPSLQHSQLQKWNVSYVILCVT